MKIASIGECMIELSAAESDRWRMGYAGDTFNTLWAMRALTPEGTTADYVSAFGDDPFSAGQRAFFCENGIGTAQSPTVSGARPGLYAISLNGAERSFTYWRADAAARQLASDRLALEKSLSDRALVYFSGITLAILEPSARAILLEAIAIARTSGARIAFDPNYRPRLWPNAESARAAIDAALRTVDIALPTFPDEQALYGDAEPAATAKRLAGLGVHEIVVKNGEEPALVHAGGIENDVAAQLVSDAVDTTGAGDSFNGAYLAARLSGDEPVAAAHRAHRVAGAVIRVRGALAPFDVLKRAFEA
jgi:2-dehydro-3-deoxygluconokinase